MEEDQGYGNYLSLQEFFGIPAARRELSD